MAKVKTSRTSRLALIAVAMLAAGSAIADKPSSTGGGKHNKNQQNEKYDKRNDHQQGNNDNKAYHDQKKSNFSGGKYFVDQHQMVIRDYYDNQYKTHHCPPGLAKKNNGCMPPGQAKKWAIGQRLPRDVVYYDLPWDLLNTIGLPPSGYRFVRVASDILMISNGTGTVVDVINNLGRY